MIIIENDTWAVFDGPILKAKKVLDYTKKVWTKSGAKDVQRTLLLPNKRFPVGLINRFDEKVIKKGTKPKPTRQPKLRNITFRDYQKAACLSGMRLQRGVITSPTGSGKTAIIGGIISAFPGLKFCVLVHTKDLLDQISDNLNDFGLPNFKIGDGNKKWVFNKRICVATAQTLCGMKQPYQFDGIIVDECHRVGVIDGRKKTPDLNQHGVILSRNIDTPIKLGLTGSMPTDNERLLWIEGLLGPIIYKVKEETQVKRGLLAKVKMTFLDPSKPQEEEAEHWREIYQEAITKSKFRAMLIDLAVKERKGKSILIFVKFKEHGELLAKKTGLPFIHGGTPSNVRRVYQKKLEAKQIPGIISTIWKEGIDIKSLDVVVLAGGGKSVISLLQWIGRGLRTTATKKEVEIIDFIDTEKVLAAHFAERMRLYCRKGWI